MGPYFAVRLWSRRGGRPFDSELAGALGLSAAFLFAAVGHFARTEPMAQMLPPWVPYRIGFVYVAGVVEIVLAAALLIPHRRRLAAWGCIAVLVAFFPANIYAAIHRVGLGGHQWGPLYLLIRAPLQLLLIGWAYWLVARRPVLTSVEGATP